MQKLFDVMWVQFSKRDPNVGFCKSLTVTADELPGLLVEIQSKGHELVTVETRRSPATEPVGA